MYASGGNYRIELVEGLVRWTVWARPDVDSNTGARFAEEQAAHATALALGSSRGLCFDLSAAPTVMGPRTQAAIVVTLAPWERVRKPVAIVLSDNAMQRLQWDRLVREHLAKSARLFAAMGPALEFLATARPALGSAHALGRDE
jgi:hypothetical protein